jgi:hypothetical protein
MQNVLARTRPATLAATLALAIPTLASGQSAVGLRAGSRWSQLDGGGNGAGRVTELVVGGYFGFGLSDRVALQFEAAYGGRGAEAVTVGTGTAVTGQLDMQYLDVPVILRAGFPGERLLPSLFVGPYFGFLLSCELTPEGGDAHDCDAEGETARFSPRATDVGLVVGGALDFLMGENTVFVDVRYTAGLLSIASSSDPLDARHAGLAVSGGFAFPLGR